MELLLSNFPPASYSNNSSRRYFEQAIKGCVELKIASGYISSDALIDLKRIIELNGRPKLDLMIGMHFFDGFTRGQYRAAIELNSFLKDHNLGSVKLSDRLKFHGKMYSFLQSDSSRSAIIGSSNLGSLYDGLDRLYETDILLKGTESLDISRVIEDIINKLGTSLEEIQNIRFVANNKLLENHENVRKVESEELAKIQKSTLKDGFRIPIKAEPKSHLNPYFGKGRDNHRGYIAPRPWYEVEIIVSKKITSLPGYPRSRSFTVFTDDGWSFKCETNGTNSKNFRSKDDLKILGKWIKGRMEEDGALEIGTRVTREIIESYGRDYITLLPTDNPDIWYIDFKPSK